MKLRDSIQSALNVWWKKQPHPQGQNLGEMGRVQAVGELQELEVKEDGGNKG